MGVSEGFVVPRETGRLVDFEEPYVGLEVVVRLDIDIETVIEMEVARTYAGSDEAKDDPEADWTHIKMFAEHVLDGWNLRLPETQEAIPATWEGAKKVGAKFMHIIFANWYEAQVNVPAPLGDESELGDTLAEASTPIPDGPSESRQSSPAPDSSTGSPDGTVVPLRSSSGSLGG